MPVRAGNVQAKFSLPSDLMEQVKLLAVGTSMSGVVEDALTAVVEGSTSQATSDRLQARCDRLEDAITGLAGLVQDLLTKTRAVQARLESQGKEVAGMRDDIRLIYDMLQGQARASRGLFGSRKGG